MNTNSTRRGFLTESTVLAASLLLGSRTIAAERSGRKITVYKNPT